jgi:hypothetical protein
MFECNGEGGLLGELFDARGVCVCSSSTWERNLCVECGQVLASAWGCPGQRENVCVGAFNFAAGAARPACIVGEMGGMGDVDW